jgi:hypothetical protein
MLPQLLSLLALNETTDEAWDLLIMTDDIGQS